MAGQRPPSGDTLRVTILQRDGYVCQRCGDRAEPLGNATLYVHHFGGAYTEANLVTVCGACFNELEPSTREGFELERRSGRLNRAVEVLRGVLSALRRRFDR